MSGDASEDVVKEIQQILNGTTDTELSSLSHLVQKCKEQWKAIKKDYLKDKMEKVEPENRSSPYHEELHFLKLPGENTKTSPAERFCINNDMEDVLKHQEEMEFALSGCEPAEALGPQKTIDEIRIHKLTKISVILKTKRNYKKKEKNFEMELERRLRADKNRAEAKETDEE